MANVLAVNQRKTYRMVDKKKVKVPPPSAANLAHAATVTKANYWFKEANEETVTTSMRISTTTEVNRLWQEWETKARTTYKQHHKAHRSPPKGTVLIEEMMLVIGTDVEIEDHKTLIRAYVKKFEEKYNTKVLYWADHNHEGHIDDNGKEKINRHIHIFFSNIDHSGKSVRRQWQRHEMSQMQSDVFEVGKSVGLRIERATKYAPGTAPKQKSHRQVRAEKSIAQQKRTAAKIKDLKAETKRLREELREQGAKREDYAKLEALVRQLLQQIRQKDLTIEELKEKLKQPPTPKQVAAAQVKIGGKLDTMANHWKSAQKKIAEQEQELERIKIEMEQLRSENKRLLAQIPAATPPKPKKTVKTGNLSFEDEQTQEDPEVWARRNIAKL